MRSVMSSMVIILISANVTHGQVIDLYTGGTIPNASACVAPHFLTGTLVEVQQMSGPSLHWAHATYNNQGWPTIVYGNMYFNLPEFMQRFTSFHECGHLAIPTTDEIQSNCYALEQLFPDELEMQDIGNFHGAIGPLPPQYGGSGEAFWMMTANACPQYF